MALLNTGLCLPKLDIEALCQGKSIVTITKRFMVPGKRFILYPLKLNLFQNDLSKIYRLDFLNHLEGNETFQDQEIIAWAKCEFCQSYSEKEKIFSIASKTIWSSQYLEEQLNDRGNLFLTFLQVYKLPQVIAASNFLDGSAEEPLRGFIPLPDYLDVDEDNPILDRQKFEDIKDKLLNPVIDAINPTNIKDNDQSELTLSVTDNDKIEKHDQPELTLSVTDNDKSKQYDDTENIVDSPNWFEHISRVGNSSDGHTFEKLVRKSFLELGFTNSRNDTKVSLDPHATGGAGGLDLYCDAPYPVVGECKATKTTKMPAATPSQLIRLGNNHLGYEHYSECIKIIIAAGELTKDADRSARENFICVIRPETLQRLVELKKSHPGSFTLAQLQEAFEKSPFGQESDKELDKLINFAWNQIEVRSRLIETVRIRSSNNKKAASVSALLEFHNGRFNDYPDAIINPSDARDLLIELSSPLTGYLGRTKNATSGEEGFYFIRELKIEN